MLPWFRLALALLPFLGQLRGRAPKDVDVRKTTFDKWFKDKQGRLAIGQKPNLPIIVWAIAELLAWPFSGRAEHFFAMLAFGALFTWAWLEIRWGINRFRRLLGAAVMIYLLVSIAV
ncbi:MAG TPA: hypothetical protein VFH39_00680 [Candidatus Saccharimonadales bacterium]|nr:hypothetical protein [Candidatus Saccharimonadales bacterium]